MSSTSMPISHNNAPSNEAESPHRPQADPLPSKRGEIGYIEAAAAESPAERSQVTTSNTHVLPARHPADRDHSPISSDAVIPPAQSEDVTHPRSESSPCTASIIKSHGILDIFKPERSPAFGGLRLTTLLIFIAQTTLLGGTVTAWVFTSERIVRLMTSGQNPFAAQPSTILVHLAFILVILVQLVFLERRIFRLRGERYSYVHPGEVLPRHRNNIPQSSTNLAFAPWNRPPLPTYAAALAQSGVGTGDVEDHLIAVSPPPAYGNTRGSTLILSGFLRNSLRAQNRQINSSPALQEFDTDRPLSYVSRDEHWDEIQDAERTRRLEETLN